MLVPTPILKHLGGADPTLGRVIRKIGPLDITPQPGGFDRLARSIMHQSLGLRAASTIIERVVTRAGGPPLTPERVATLRERDLITCGLSRPKIRYLRGLAAAVASGELRLARLARLSDEAVMEELTKVCGIGQWTAEMYLIFVLSRHDVFPVLDAGIRAAVGAIYKIPPERFRAEAPLIAERWRPYRSIACRYLWEWLDSRSK
ncbi:MAG TPA: DNA-3-methyladenine glycosylase 2 family protein [candidate division Zixibacteria bacterium]|nr:DNA-3-methyladenine glycosylase 2 family protein [candidate division Zixibacteria bacterium]MDD4917122.1 DNA-3-methyladenine glycosylase 2 family protein [candidate division Zixibacteria bacterium]MDM7972694.1 DNA-3-methyladenine glycosylase 2 family protein [candidate division Zixibacteria bacterium]HOZ07878.1 DNA-3-methyladenine glycosylase 2 family protein [candidate division Zixibacteria bacterium]HPI32676.1 DNA-3-methyladenine glycosylase 2 family protein [candidate division Zixibacteri